MVNSMLELLIKNIKCRDVLRLVLIHVILIGLICVLIFLAFPCPFRWIFRYPCPACGIVHALRSLLMLNLEEYMSYNYLALPMVSAVWLGIHKKLFGRYGRVIDMYVYSVCAIVTIKYFLKIYVDFFISK